MTTADDLDDIIEEEFPHLVQFFDPPVDLEPNLNRAIELVEGLDPNRSDYTLDQIIEFYNIVLFIVSGHHLESWSRQRRQRFAGATPALKSIVDRYFDSISRENFSQRTTEFEITYQQDFLHLFARYQLADIIPQADFGGMVYNNEIHLVRLLSNDYIVANYGGFVRRMILERPLNAEWLIEAAASADGPESDRLHLPASLTAAEQANLIGQYVASGMVLPMYLDNIVNRRGDLAKIGIATRTIIEARRQLTAIKKRLGIDSP